LRDILGPYGGWWLRQILAEPGAFLIFILQNGVHLTGRVLALLLPVVSGPPIWAGLVLLIPLGLGLWEIGRRSWTLPLTLLFGLGIVLVWPFSDIRLAVPLHPLLVLGTGMGFKVVLDKPKLDCRFRGGMLALGILWAAWMVGASGYRLATGFPGEPFRIRSEALVKAVRNVQENTPPEAIVGAPELWAGLHLFTGRRVAPSAPFHPLGEDQAIWGTPREQFQLWTEAGLTHLLVEHGGRTHGEALDRLDALCPDGGVWLLVNEPGQFLVLLGWDEDCRERALAEGEGEA
jgi:hypothetical protein